MKFVTTICLSILISSSVFADGRKIIANPYKYVWDGEGKISGITRFFLDINDDGESELFVGANSLIGNGGGEFEVFQKAKGAYVYLGSVFCSPRNLDILTTKHHGFHDLRTCSHMSSEECNLTVFEFDGKKYYSKTQQLIKGSALPIDYRPIKVTEEKSSKELNWKP